MRAILTATLLGLGTMAGGALADPVDNATARAMLFAPSGMIFYPVEPTGLEGDAVGKVEALQNGLVDQMASFEKVGYGYYGALAVPQGLGLTPQSLIMTQGLHSPTAAQETVLKECKEAHGVTCTVIGLTLPAGYEPRDFSLSAAATESFVEAATDGAARVVAYSPSTAGSAMVKGSGEAAEAAALKACNEGAGGAADCVIGVAD